MSIKSKLINISLNASVIMCWLMIFISYILLLGRKTIEAEELFLISFLFMLFAEVVIWVKTIYK
ncbi:hypothetical protein SP99_04565 [Enterobacter sp. BIDMC92]|nr:hypothetical protein SP99_04565 [Enterobacter sp. BIDMC92]